jgi:hypothetical protein
MGCAPSCFCRAHRCDQDSYLRVSFLDGHVEHVDGPVQLFFNPRLHLHVEVVQHQRYVASEKQCVDIVHRDGRLERRLGPCEVTFDPFVHASLNTETVRRFVASQGEYMVIQFKDGRKEHQRGPLEVNFHPLEHEVIQVVEALKLAANEAVVVYRRQAFSAPEQDGPSLLAKAKVVPTTTPVERSAASARKGNVDGDAGVLDGARVRMPAPDLDEGVPLLTTEDAGEAGAMHVERRVVHGPAVFIPNSNEWLHTFSWHGTRGSDGKGSKTGFCGDVKVPHALNFQVLRCMCVSPGLDPPLCSV